MRRFLLLRKKWSAYDNAREAGKFGTGKVLA
jgi:glutaredoxin-related protein